MRSIHHAIHMQIAMPRECAMTSSVPYQTLEQIVSACASSSCLHEHRQALFNAEQKILAQQITRLMSTRYPLPPAFGRNSGHGNPRPS